MRWPFRRRAGRHQLGAAVTGIPSAPPVAPAPAAPPVRPAVRTPAPAPEAVTPEPAPEADTREPAPEAPAPRQARIELGFRDGSTAALAPESEQAQALRDIASALTRRD